MDDFNERHPHGSARFASLADARQAGLFKVAGPVLGYLQQQMLHIDGDAPIITIAGAGSGKLRDVLAYNVCGYRTGRKAWTGPPRLFVNDSRGELAAISIQNHVRMGKAVFCFNPFGLHGLPQHKLNPLDMLVRRSRTLHADIKLLTTDLIPLSGSSNAEYFELRGRQCTEAFTHTLVEEWGGVTLPQLYDMVNAVQDPTLWPAIAEQMLASETSLVRRTAIELDTMRQEAPKEFSAIMGELVKSLNFLSDPAIREMLSGADFSLNVLCEQDCSVFNIVPAEYVNQLAPLNRLIVGAAMLYKFRQPSAPRILFLIDEAATLGRFESLLRGYSYGRGMGIRMWSIWQDVGQITRNFGQGALSTFLGSSQTRQFFGVRDLDTARVVSAMLGTESLMVHPVLDQAAAGRNVMQLARQMLEGGDPFLLALNGRQQALAAVTPFSQARPLMAPDEILSMPEDWQILFISGLGMKPLLAQKYPYYVRAEMAGGYMPNPYHPPGGSVWLKTFFGLKQARVVTETVPLQYAVLPQYRCGQWSYIAGYRPD